ncbi:MAG: hypothetical protein IJM63_11740 [Solobacterium sp.]|nr:hypothetical protein [Solobacterium sp.]
MTDFTHDFSTESDSGKKLTRFTGNDPHCHAGSLSDDAAALRPEELTAPSEVSSDTLSMMDRSNENFRTGNVSAPVDLSEFENESHP